MGMTTDDIKEQFSMADVVERYGLHPDRAGFIHCPFHNGDNTASLKVYKKSFYCFGCQKGGDIFEFVMLMDDCSFKDAYKSLGGESGRLSDAAIMRIAKRKKEAKAYQKRLDKALNDTREVSDLYLMTIALSRIAEPFSDDWCFAQNLIPVLQARADEALETYLDVIREGK